MAVAVEAVGWAGAAGLLVAYALVSGGRIRAGRRYQVLNVLGSAALATNAAVHHAWPSSALNLVWLAIGVAALIRPPAGRAGQNSPSGLVE